MIVRLITPILWFAFFLFLIASVALIIGEEQERKIWASTPDTLHLYTSNEVCTHEASGKVLNCGHCGSCSNLHDIRKYHQHKLTLSEIMTDCAKGDLLLGNDAFSCLKQRVGMTDDCSKCWVLNYQCNIQNCVRTCLKHRFMPFLPSINGWNSDPVDPCFACDEKLCGPIFVGCAGANRRRTGIVSDIERKTDRELCDKVDWDWVLQDKVGTSEDAINTASNSEL